MKHLKLILPLVFILFSCSNDSDNSNQESNATLELNVFDDSDSPLNDITVSIYSNLTDYNNGTNAVEVLNTDFTGKVVFENLAPITYYWKTSSPCYADDGVNFSTVNPIDNNNINSFSTNLLNDGTGIVLMENNSSYDYSISYTGPESGSIIISAHSILSIEDLDVGNYIFTYTQINGPFSFPLNINLSVNCGESTQLLIN